MTRSATAEARNLERLTKRVIDAAEPRGTRYTLWDRDLKGFGLRVEPSGVKTFIVRYRAGGGRRGTPRQLKIGRFGKLTADQARAAAGKYLADAELGGDPHGSRVADRAMLTVGELCDVYRREGVATKKASTLKLDDIRIARHIKPLIGSRRINKLSVSDVERLCQDIEGQGPQRLQIEVVFCSSPKKFWLNGQATSGLTTPRAPRRADQRHTSPVESRGPLSKKGGAEDRHQDHAKLVHGRRARLAPIAERGSSRSRTPPWQGRRASAKAGFAY